MQGGVVGLLGVHDEVLGDRPPVFVRPEPGREDRRIVAHARLGPLPALEELAVGAVGGALDDDLGAGQVRHRLHHAGEVRRSVLPERRLRAVQQLDGLGAADGHRACRANGISAVQPVELQLTRIASSRRGFDRRGTVIMEALDHAEQIVGGVLFVGQDEGVRPPQVRHLPIETRLDVGREPLLSRLEHQGAHLAPGTRPLGLQLFVQMPLSSVQDERVDLSGLGPDSEAPFRVVREVVPQPTPDRTVMIVHHVARDPPPITDTENPPRRGRAGVGRISQEWPTGYLRPSHRVNRTGAGTGR